MEKNQPLIHGLIGSALIGVDPFHPRSWSGISRHFFLECQRQGILHGADGGDVGGIKRLIYLARCFHPDRSIWRLRYYLHPRYRNALTRVIQKKMAAVPAEVPLIQFGALFDAPSVAKSGQRCFSYHDGNMAQRISNPFASVALPTALAQAAMSYEKAVYDRLDGIFTMSEHLRQSFIQDFDQAPEKVHCIGAGVNLDDIPSENPDKRYDTQEVLFVGADFERKGGHVLLKAFSRARQRHPEATLHIAGPRSAPPSDLPLEGVQWHGHLRKNVPSENARLESLFASSSLFVLPSLYEPFGIAPAEAMIQGIPAVVSKAWALQETVHHRKTGEHVPPGDEDALAETLERLLGQSSELQQLGQEARRDALSRFTWEGVVNRCHAHIRKVERPTLPDER